MLSSLARQKLIHLGQHVASIDATGIEKLAPPEPHRQVGRINVANHDRDGLAFLLLLLRQCDTSFVQIGW